MRKEKVTVIIPVYNMQDFLSQCLDSMISQTLTEMEILCIDDGSTDQSPEILDRYADMDHRIRVIRKENGGLVSARKCGVELAGGDYIGFVDSDDWVAPKMFERLHHVASHKNADMVSSDYWQEGAYSSISRDAVEAGVYDEAQMGLLRGQAILNFKKHDKGISGSLCTKLFRADLLKKVMPLIPEQVKVSEDKITMLTFLLECRCAVILHEAYYHYRINPTSMFHAQDPDYLLNYHYVYTYFKQLYSHRNFTEVMRRQAELYIVQFLIKGINKQMGFSFRNLMWIDPLWLVTPTLGKRVMLCGGGELGEVYRKHLEHSKEKEFAGYIELESKDSNAARMTAGREDTFDSVVITVKHKSIADDMRHALLDMGISKDRIFWFQQEEIIWRYAEAIGLLEEK